MQQRTLKVSIPSGASISSDIDISNFQPLSINTSAAWTAAQITLQVSRDGVNWYDVFYDNGDEVKIEAAANRHIGLNAPVVWLQYLRLRSGTSDTPVNQSALRTIYIVGTVVNQ